MNLKDTLLKHINAYHITLSNGLEFWAPYIRNDNYTEMGKNFPRGVGKSAASEIKEAAEYIISLFPDADAETVRRKLIDGSLPDTAKNYKGIECSGFVFHVMNNTYIDYLGKELMDDLSVPKAHVLNGALNLEEWMAAHKLTQEEIDSLPEDVPMRWVVETFKRQPRSLCRVAGLVSDFSSIKIDYSNLRAGDLLYTTMIDDPIPHILIVTEISSTEIECYHSGRKNPEDTGGVSKVIYPIVNGELDVKTINHGTVFQSFRRLKSLI